MLIEAGDDPGRHVRERLAAEIDRQLAGCNCEYDEKRDSARLRPLRAVVVPDGSWDELADRRQQRAGSSREQYKHPYLVGDLEFAGQFAAGPDGAAEPVGASAEELG